MASNRVDAEIIAAMRARAAEVIRAEITEPDTQFRQLIEEFGQHLDDQPDEDSQKPGNVARKLLANTEILDAITHEVGADKKFGYVGHGASAIAFSYHDDDGHLRILRITDAVEGRYPHSDLVLKPLQEKSIGGIQLQVNEPVADFRTMYTDPHNVISTSEARQIEKAFDAMLIRDGLVMRDAHDANYAITADGRFLTHDLGAVHTIAEHERYLADRTSEIDRTLKTQQFQQMVADAAILDPLHPIRNGAAAQQQSGGQVIDPAARAAIQERQLEAQRALMEQKRAAAAGVDVEPSAARIPAGTTHELMGMGRHQAAPVALTAEQVASTRAAQLQAQRAAQAEARGGAGVYAEPVGRASHLSGLGGGAAIGMGMLALGDKLGEHGTLRRDVEKGGAQAGLALVSTGVDTAAIAVDATELMKGSSVLGRAASRVAMPVAVVAGALEAGTAVAAKDGHRAARAVGATGGGILGGMAAGAGLGALGGTIVPGAGNVVGALVGGIAGGYFGAEAVGKFAEEHLGKKWDTHLNRFTVDQKALDGLEKAKGWKEILDKDKDGNIEFDEVKAAFKKYGVSAASVDKNGDGKATADEIGAALNAAIKRKSEQSAQRG